jgi:hypothetical protein
MLQRMLPFVVDLGTDNQSFWKVKCQGWGLDAGEVGDISHQSNRRRE